MLSAPSGAGKTSLVNAALERFKKRGLNRVITYTSRAPRAGEVDGVDYHFISEDEFKQKVDQDFFIEWSGAYKNYYGSPMSTLDEVRSGASRLMVVDHAGAVDIKRTYPEAVFIWITVPSQSILEDRLAKRNTENPQDQAVRLAVGKEEMQKELANPVFSYYIVNISFDIALSELTQLIGRYLTS